MALDFSTVTAWAIPEGLCKKVNDPTQQIWPKSGPWVDAAYWTSWNTSGFVTERRDLLGGAAGWDTQNYIGDRLYGGITGKMCGWAMDVYYYAPAPYFKARVDWSGVTWPYGYWGAQINNTTAGGGSGFDNGERIFGAEASSGWTEPSGYCTNKKIIFIIDPYNDYIRNGYIERYGQSTLACYGTDNTDYKYFDPTNVTVYLHGTISKIWIGCTKSNTSYESGGSNWLVPIYNQDTGERAFRYSNISLDNYNGGGWTPLFRN